MDKPTRSESYQLGEKLYDHYTKYRDFSGSTNDEYAQLLETLRAHLLEELFVLLYQAGKMNKRSKYQGRVHLSR